MRNLLIILCCAVVLVDTIFFAALAPLLPHYEQSLDVSRFALGVLNGAYGAGAIAGAVPAAWLTARIGVRPVTWVGLVILALTSVLFGVSNNAWDLIILRFSGGIGSTCSWIAVFTWVITAASDEYRGQVIGTLISAAVAGSMLGPLLGSAAAALGVLPIFTLMACLALGVAAALIFQSPPAQTQFWSWSALHILARPKPTVGLLLIALCPLLFSTLVVLAPLQLSHLGWGATGIGSLFFLGALFETLLHPLAGHWTDQAGYHPPIITSLALSIVLLFILPAANSSWLFSACVVCAAGVFNLALTPSTVLFTQSLDRMGGGQAFGFALTEVAWSGGFTIGAPLGGWLSDFGGNYLAYIPLAAICGLMIFAIQRVV
ncbi:MFS transporter [Salinisphaera sp. USBA-960]|nr:MFS transporter [Salifodinibacter halophilus]NNC26322.1 MFS transporter [Salifodinibacter halophilus]